MSCISLETVTSFIGNIAFVVGYVMLIGGGIFATFIGIASLYILKRKKEYNSKGADAFFEKHLNIILRRTLVVVVSFISAYGLLVWAF